MLRTAVIISLLILAGCLATDPAAREAKRQEKAAFREAVANLRILQADSKTRVDCKPLEQVIGKGGMAPRSYEADMQHAIQMAKESVVRSGGNAIQIISSQLSDSFPKEIIIIAQGFDCKFKDKEKTKVKPVPENK